MATYDDAGLLPSGLLAPYGENVLKYGIGQLGTPIDVGKLTPQVAGQSAFQQKAAQGIADLGGLGTVQRDASGQVTGFTGGTGVASYQPYLDNISQQNLLDPGQGYQQFMSPYQQEIINTTLADFDRQAQIGQQTVSDAAYTAGAFGGGREAASIGEYQATGDIARAMSEANLRQQGFQQAQAAAAGDLVARQGLGTYQSQMGGQQRQLDQARLAADQEAARETAFADYTQLGLVGPQLASVIGGFPAATQVQSTPPPSATQQLLGLGIGAAGLMGAIRG